MIAQFQHRQPLARLERMARNRSLQHSLLARLLAGVLPALLATTGCDQDVDSAPLASLGPVGSVSVVCLARDENGDFTVGRPASECPDVEHDEDDPAQRRLLSLVTQPGTGEVAVVDIRGAASVPVTDVEPTQPGFSFLPIGAKPDIIISTPGGVASFATTLEVGREGIFALPSSCIQARPDTGPARDIRSWPACQLPVAPGPMVLLLDPAEQGLVRASCDSAESVPPTELPAAAANREICPADLSLEEGPLGRQKIAIALPELSEVWILDAQALLDRTPGSFDGCIPELRLSLSNAMVPQEQSIPAELMASSNSCALVPFERTPTLPALPPHPADFALADNGHLYIADSAAPVIHVLDASQPCDLRALAPLQPMSLLDPSAVITTRRVAVSALTPLGKRFVYAVDNSSTQTAGSLIPFDVSPGTSDPTPLIRERATHSPQLPPDRITLNGRVADVDFSFIDAPIARANTGSSTSVSVRVQGIACEPDPEQFSSTTPEAGYREGASPLRLRGTFAFAAMNSGQVRVIDVEDLDQLCRRPVLANSGETEDLAGCSGDPEVANNTFVTPLISTFTGLELDTSEATVSAELSCHVVTPHWPRASRRFLKGNLVSVLESFPSLTLETGRAVASDQSDEGVNLPKMLAARHLAGTESVLTVGANNYRTGVNSTQTLDLDPSTATRNSLLFSYASPRELVGETFAAIYEGVVRPFDQGRFTMDDSGDLGRVSGGVNALFCSAGLRDMDAARLKGASLGVAEAELDIFARRHADYLQVIGELKEKDDDYWQSDAGSQCGTDLFQLASEDSSSGYNVCEQFFGNATLPGRERDLRIVAASETQLIFEPRTFDPNVDSVQRRRETLEFLGCCFPEPTFYQARAGHQWLVRGEFTRSPHPMITDAESLRCVADCSPMTQGQQSRVFEISCGNDCPVNAAGNTPLGAARPGLDTACIVEDVQDGIDPQEPGSECIFQSLTTRFAIYRGQQPSNRDMSFRWSIASGFSTVSIELASDSDFSSPLSLFPISRPTRYLIPDSTAVGLTVYSPREFVSSSIF